MSGRVEQERAALAEMLERAKVAHPDVAKVIAGFPCAHACEPCGQGWDDQAEFDDHVKRATIHHVLDRHQPFVWSFGQGPVQSCRLCRSEGASEREAEWPCVPVSAAILAVVGGVLS